MLYIIKFFTGSTLVTKCAANQVGFSNLCVRLNVAQTLSTVVDVEHDNDEDNISTDGSICTIIPCYDGLHGTYIDSRIYG